jgi:hypothetical protein
VSKLGFPLGLKLDVWHSCDFASVFVDVSAWFCVHCTFFGVVFVNNGPEFFVYFCWRNVEIISFSIIDGFFFFNLRGKLNRAGDSVATSRWDQNNLMLGTEMILVL